jgi:hypothetical protein
MTPNNLSALTMVLLFGVPLVGGCGNRPQMPVDSRNLIGSLRTAVSAQRKDWLEENAKLVDKKRSDKKLTDEQYAEFEAIIADARNGDWSAAEMEVIRLEKAQ